MLAVESDGVRPQLRQPGVEDDSARAQFVTLRPEGSPIDLRNGVPVDGAVGAEVDHRQAHRTVERHRHREGIQRAPCLQRIDGSAEGHLAHRVELILRLLARIVTP
jgi:hypothetical protein